MTIVEAPKEPVAISKLEVLLDAPVAALPLPVDTTIRAMPDGSVRVEKFSSIWWRLVNSTVIWIQAAAGVVATIWLAVPQEAFLSVVPAKYVAWGTIFYAIVTSLARMRSL